MPSKRHRLWACMLFCAIAVGAEEPPPPPPQPDPDSAARPERQLRPLPTDTFTPSEEISEDFPVPFPVDI